MLEIGKLNARVWRRKKKLPDPENMITRVWEMKMPQWDPRGEIMSTHKALFCGNPGLEKKKGAARPEKGGNPGLRDENITVGPVRRNYVNL